MVLSPKILMISVPCREGNDGSNACGVFIEHRHLPSIYQDTAMSSGVTTEKVMME